MWIGKSEQIVHFISLFRQIAAHNPHHTSRCVMAMDGLNIHVASQTLTKRQLKEAHQAYQAQGHPDECTDLIKVLNQQDNTPTVSLRSRSLYRCNI